ncbi:hypothetical protein [Thermodesulforhabdus norvegica]|uniref:Uncharacterized protein n=1 Tax=Thermodesulforhabdus norvegica TaxID=39841 RepID=A0A1I4S3C2_9BACT|nr:hypothetical protein [Thermodesulforhabdus norvegica]SFM58753.1 hypothetical protein SAMN05660836_00716 [Thermodesulforhabdus norvegica]
MSFVAAAIARDGAVVVTDGRAMGWSPDGSVVNVQVDRIIPVGKNALIAAGGAPEAVEMAKKAAAFIHDEGLEELNRIFHALVAFLAGEYEAFMRKKCQVVPVDPTHYIHFLLVGYDAPEDAFKMFLIWNKKKLPSLDGEQVGPVFSVPRIMSLEVTLMQMVKEGAGVGELVKEIEKRISSVEKISDDIGPPWKFMLIDREGIKRA